MMVSPKAAEAAGDKFGLKPVCAGPYKFVERVQQDRIVVEKFADYWNKDHVFIDKITYLPIVDGTVRLANLRSGGLDLIERVLATDIKTVRDNPKLKLSKRRRARLPRPHHEPRQRPQGRHAARQGRRVRRASSSRSTATPEPGGVQRRVRARQPMDQPAESLLSADLPDPQARRRQGQGAAEGSGRHDPITLDFMVPNGPETRAVAEVVQSMAAEAGFDLKIRVTEFATSLKQAEDGEYQIFLIGWSGRSDPDGNSYSFQTCGSPQNNSGYCDKEVDAAHKRGARPRAIRPSARRPTRRSPPSILADGSIMYLYHTQVLVAHTDKLEGYKQMPDGLVRVDRRQAEVGSDVLAFLTQRLLQIIPTLILVSMMIFGLQQLLPGDPALIMAGEERDPDGAGGDPRAVPARTSRSRSSTSTGSRAC